MNKIRTDLALEAHEIALGSNTHVDGVEVKEREADKVKITEVKIVNKNGEEATGKPQGNYITAEMGKLWLDDIETFKKKVFALSDVIKEVFGSFSDMEGSILVAGLGNRHITADAVGPRAVDNIIVTRHIKSSTPLVFENLGLCDVAAITPGVLGQTGIESSDILKSVVQKISPRVLVVVDALASRNLARLATTIQISDSGLSPGSGVGNNREPINRETMGIPVIAVGVPTVVDAATMAYDAAEACFSQAGNKDVPSYDSIKEKLSQNDLNYFVTPKETDSILNYLAMAIGYSFNLALNENLGYEDMLSLLG